MRKVKEAIDETLDQGKMVEAINAIDQVLLAKAAGGEIDIMHIIALSMSDRGYDKKGMWVGFSKAKIAWGI